MNNYIHKLLVMSLLAFSFCLLAQDADKKLPVNEFDSVDHKNLQLDLYLDLIRYNTHEKIGILPYILKNPEGVYLEIGTGGDPIADIFSQIPSHASVTIIASDVDENVLKSLPVRHPHLRNYIDAQHGPKLKLIRLDATNMGIFGDNSFNGINASSIVHEIISYAGGFHGMDSFFKESFRTLKPGGILVYRDPECVLGKREPVSIALKNKNIRLFAHIFLYKFLDIRGSSLHKSGRKMAIYHPEDVTFTVFKKNATSASTLTYQEYLHTPSYDIDFSRRYVINLPCGLYRELARHYLTYLHQCNPLVFVKNSPDIFSNHYSINYLAHSTKSILFNFFAKKGEVLDGEKVSGIQKRMLDQEIENKVQVLEFGVPLRFSSRMVGCKLRNLLMHHNFNPCNHIIALNDKDYLLDYRILGILYDDIKKEIFDEFNGIITPEDEVHAQWLKREGEEYYFYLSDDELIARVLETTITECINDQGNKEFFVLCPLSPDHNEFVDRLCYTAMLNDSLEVTNQHGYEIAVSDGKRVIHFSKMPLKHAISVCRNIIKKDPLRYEKLQFCVDTIESTYNY